jgi:hypothetical protein
MLPRFPGSALPEDCLDSCRAGWRRCRGSVRRTSWRYAGPDEAGDRIHANQPNRGARQARRSPAPTRRRPHSRRAARKTSEFITRRKTRARSCRRGKSARGRIGRRNADRVVCRCVSTPSVSTGRPRGTRRSLARLGGAGVIESNKPRRRRPTRRVGHSGCNRTPTVLNATGARGSWNADRMRG